MTVKLHAFICKDSGIALAVRKVSPNLLLEFQREFDERNPVPEAPTQRINYGTEDRPEWREEKNESHPEYKKALADRRSLLNNESQSLLIDRGVVIEMSDDDKASVKELRDYWKSSKGKQLAGSDKEVFVRYIALGTSEDMQELVQAITRRTQPTEVAVTEKLKSL